MGEMFIGQFIEYKGYVGSIEYDLDNDVYFGKLLNIKDLINYEGDNIFSLYRHYLDAVDDYIEILSYFEKKR